MNCLVTNNTALSGGGIFMKGDVRALAMANTVFYGNKATGVDGGDAVWFDGANPAGTPATLSNAVLWSDPTPGTAFIRYTSADSNRFKIQESDVQGTIPSQIVSVNNIALAPQFVDPDGDNGILGDEDDKFQLTAGSPCVDNGDQSLRRPDFGDLDGDSNVAELTPRDLDLNERWIGTNVDMGAYELPECTVDDDCDPTDACLGQGVCTLGVCSVVVIPDCNQNGREDWCDALDGPNCNNNQIPDECEGGTVPIALVSSVYACDDSLPRTQGNVLRMTFKCPVPTGTGNPVRIQPLAAGGGYGSDLASSFRFTWETGNTVLRIAEEAQTSPYPPIAVLSNQVWYGIREGVGWPRMGPFKRDYVTVFGDADNTKVNDFADLSFIYGHQGAAQGDQDRSDINADTFVDNADISDAYGFNGSYAPTKPTEHTCAP
jgi:predicted outer membrane repeat protein